MFLNRDVNLKLIHILNSKSNYGEFATIKNSMKKPFEETVVGKITITLGKIFLGSFLKKQKFIKTDQDKKNVDDVLDQI